MSTPYRPCPQCGMPQVPNQGFCSNCGARFIGDAGSFAPTELASPPGVPDPRQLLSPSTPANGQPSSPYDSTQYGNNGYGNGGQVYTPSPSPNVGYPPPDPYGVGNSYPPSGPYGAGSGYPPSDPYGAGQYAQQQSSGYSRNSRGYRRRRKNNFLVPVLGILTVIVILGGGLFAYISTKNTGKVGATPTPAAKSQPASPTALTKQAPLFADNFASNSKNWDLRSASGYGATIGNSELTMKENNHRIFQEPVPTAIPDDFMVTTTFTLMQGDSNDSVGLQLRTGQDNSQGYVVEVYGDDTYDIVKVAPSPNDANKLQFTTLSSPTSSPAIKAKGTPNTMTVTMKGSNLVVQFNETIVKTLIDPSFKSGSINLFLVNGDTSTGASAAFTNFTVYPAPTQLPS